jgi:hypothetical protein
MAIPYKAFIKTAYALWAAPQPIEKATDGRKKLKLPGFVMAAFLTGSSRPQFVANIEANDQTRRG